MCVQGRLQQRRRAVREVEQQQRLAEVVHTFYVTGFGVFVQRLQNTRRQQYTSDINFLLHIRAAAPCPGYSIDVCAIG